MGKEEVRWLNHITHPHSIRQDRVCKRRGAEPTVFRHNRADLIDCTKQSGAVPTKCAAIARHL